MPLTDTAIRAAKPQSKTVRMFDGGGLYLELAPSGWKWWRLKYRVEGKEKRIDPTPKNWSIEKLVFLA